MTYLLSLASGNPFGFTLVVAFGVLFLGACLFSGQPRTGGLQ